MRLFLVGAGVFMLSAQSYAQQTPAQTDGDQQVRTYRVDSVVVTSTRAGATTPMPHTDLAKEEIARRNFGRDMPYLLQMTPSVVVTSDAGAGIGYTGLRIRGTDATRINVTLDGIPMNDAESHGLFWVNTPDLASSLGSIQVQRGVGTSTNGAGAFGGSVNMLGEHFGERAHGEFSGSYGSFGTHRETFKVGTGLLGGRWMFDARLSNLHSDGYVDRATSDLKSWMARAGYRAGNTALTLSVMGGKERTYLAWEGVMQYQIDANGRTYNPLGEISDGVYYKDNTDNYNQTHYRASLLQGLGGGWSLNAALHYTEGYGYYEEYKDGVKMSEYLLAGTWGNIVRRKVLDNGFAGGVFSLNYDRNRLKASLGGAANRYDGDHYGRVLWVENYDAPLSPEHRYYNGNGTKDDANIYAKASWEALDGLFFYGDLQLRHIGYRITGTTDSWLGNTQHTADVDEKFYFFNPKAGLFYKLGGGVDIYASVAVAHREPTRNNYTEALEFVDGKPVMPRAERLTDFELGAKYTSDRLTAGVNFYYMKYKDQFVLTGENNPIGEPMARNVPDSYRAGVELMAGVEILPWLRWDGNMTLSRNRIRNFTEWVPTRNDDWEIVSQASNRLGTVDIAYSPSLIANSLFGARLGRFSAAVQTSWVGSQFVTNSNKKELSLEAYSLTDLRLGYDFGKATLGLSVNNLFDKMYSSNAWGGSYYMVGDATRYDGIGYYPQAGTNFLANLTVRF